MNNVHVIDHPLVQHKLTLMRRKETETSTFRALLQEISALLAYEVTRDLTPHYIPIETPVGPIEKAPALDVKNLVLVSVLRAGNGILDGMLHVLPAARVGHVGLYRDPKTLEAVEYYFNTPPDMNKREAIVIDPMLATGHSGSAALSRVKKTEPKRMKFVCLVAAPEGIKTIQEEHPEVPIYVAAIDECLNEKGYIVPGLGDAGDRIFGT